MLKDSTTELTLVRCSQHLESHVLDRVDCVVGQILQERSVSIAQAASTTARRLHALLQKTLQVSLQLIERARHLLLEFWL